MKKIQVISRIKQIRKGLSTQRKKVIFEEGEPVYITDKDRVYIGDNKTFGGIDSSSKNFIVTDTTIPEHGVKFDILYNKNNKCIYIINNRDQLNIINNYECQINNLSNLIDELSGMINPS